MSSASRFFAATIAAAALVWRVDAAQPLRVCSDPNNMPFSNQAGLGFENRIAELVARDLERPLTYYWWPERRGFIRNTIGARRCDLVMAVPNGFERLRTTRPYYRSTYAFISRTSRSLDVRSFDDDRLRTLTVGVQITGDDYNNPPAAQALAARNLVQNVRGYMVYGDYSKSDPQRRIVDAVADGSIDLAVVWGPIGGYYARREPVAMSVLPVAPTAGERGLQFTFDIAMGVRADDDALRKRLDDAIVQRRSEIRRILRAFGVPLS